MLQRNGTLNKVVQIAFFIFLVMALGACALRQGREDERPTITRFGNAEQLFENGTLVCSQECTDRGFCGVTDSGERVILANTQDPSTQRYNWFFVENSPVTITDFQQRIARYQVSQQNEAVFYYKVANANFEEAWVAGWCVGK